MRPISNSYRLGAALALLVIAALFAAAPALSQQKQPGARSLKLDKSALAQSPLPWTINADRLSHDAEKDLYEAEGNVSISSQDRLIRAEYASVDLKSREAFLRGNVLIQYGRNWLKGDTIEWNLDTETGRIGSGIAFFAENNFFLEGKSISKKGPTEFDLKDGFLTSCNPADPEWKIHFKEMNVKVGGFAWIRDGSFWAAGLPIGYTPVLGIPVEVSSQTGFLIPWGATSSLNGIDVEVPFYWAMRDDMDATLYSRYLEKRGFMAGAEYRVNNNDLGRGIWMFNYLKDQADPAFLLEKGYPYQTEDRFWLRSRHDLRLPWDVSAKIDLDIVSDRNYLQEFSRGSSSIDHTTKVFSRYFGRGLLYDNTSNVRESSVYLEKKWESALLSMDHRYWQNLENGQDSTTVQKLPSFSFTMLPSWIGESPFYYTLQSSAVNYWRRHGDTEQRLDVYPRIHYPFHVGNVLDVEPSVGFRSSTYAIEWENDRFDNFSQRGAPDFKIEASSRLNRVYDCNFLGISTIQHSIRPEAAYEYTSENLSGHIPHLDRLDQDQSRNGVRYGFTTFLTTRETVTDQTGLPAKGYRELARLRVFQFFNIEKPVIEDPFWSTQPMKEGFSPVGLRVDVMARKNITLSYDADFDFREGGRGDSHDLYMTLDSGRGHFLRVDYQRLPYPAVDEITAETMVKVYKDLYINAYHDYSLDQEIFFKQGYGFKILRGCWGFGIGFEREGGDNRVVFAIELRGLGSFGQARFFGRSRLSDTPTEYQRPDSWTLPK